MQRSAIVVVAEGARPKDGEEIYWAGIAGQEAPRLGGIGFYLAERLLAEQEGLPPEARYDIRATVLGHVQRGGTPSGADRVLATRFGAAAVRLIAEGKTGRMIALRGEYLTDLPLSRVARMPRTVPLDSDIVQTARELGISLG